MLPQIFRPDDSLLRVGLAREYQLKLERLLNSLQLAIVRWALEARRRVKEQQKRCLKAEFRNTHFSFFMGVDGVEPFVATPELHSDDAIETDPLPPGQIWAISPGGQDGAVSPYRIEVSVGRGSGVRILNAPKPPAFSESVRYGEQNLYTRAKALVGDRDPRGHEFSIQMRAMDVERAGAGLGLPVLLALCGGLIERSIKGALQLLMPIPSRRQLFDLPDDLATKITIDFYSDASDAFLKAIVE